ncbi:MAG: structural protein P5 [Alistipes onderdonkii]
MFVLWPDGSGISCTLNTSRNDTGLRNNNPLNIEKTRGGNPWQGEVVPSKDKRFAQFTTVVYGYRAAFKLLNNYQRNYGLDTIRKMIDRWAPSEENHTDAYVRTVAERSGCPPTVGSPRPTAT